MSGYNAKNYTEQGGDVTHIGGMLIVEKGASVEGFLQLQRRTRRTVRQAWSRILRKISMLCLVSLGRPGLWKLMRKKAENKVMALRRV